MSSDDPTPLLVFDYVDPASFLLDRALGAVEEETGIRVERLPLELRAPPAPLVDPTGEAWRERWSEAAAVAAREGIELVRPRIVPWTRKAHELALEAREHERFEPVHRTLFEAFHLEGRDLGRIDVLLEVAVAHGLDLSHTKAVLDVDRHAAAVDAARERAERLGAPGVPALLSGGRALAGLPDRGAILAFLRGT